MNSIGGERGAIHFLFLLAVSSKYNFFHLFLIAVVNLVRKQLLRFYGDR